MSGESSAAHEPSAGEFGVESCGPKSPPSPPDQDRDKVPEPDILTLGLLAALVLLLGGRPEEASPQPPEAPAQPPAEELPGLDTISLLGALLLMVLSGRSGETAESAPAVTERVVAKPVAPVAAVPGFNIPVVPTLGPFGCPTWPGTSSNWVAAPNGSGAVRIIH